MTPQSGEHHALCAPLARYLAKVGLTMSEGEAVFSRRGIRDSGKVLASEMLVEGDHVPDAYKDAFRVFYGWRDGFRPLIHKSRTELAGKAKSALGSAKGLTSGRLKRFSSIRRKLRIGMKMDQIQDVGGCRLIVPDLQALSVVRRHYDDGDIRYAVDTINDYVSVPKQDGYRSLHYVLKHTDVSGPWRPVEIQIRTQLQHAWATAVEAVGLWRGEGFKFGDGDPEWRRLFLLMAGEIAEEEGAPPIPGLANREDRQEELRDIEARLKAVTHLEGYRRALNNVEQLGRARDGLYVLDFDQTQRVTQTHFSDAYYQPGGWVSREQRSNAVLVEVESAQDLIKAFPNYFADVAEFLSRLRAATNPEHRIIHAVKGRMGYGAQFPEGWWNPKPKRE